MDSQLTNLIGNAVAEILTPEFIEKEVKVRAEKLVIESINSALKSYSPVAKTIEKALEEALRVDNLDIPSYGLMVQDILQKQIEILVHPLISSQLAKDMDELLNLAPKEIKLSQIIEDMIKDKSEYGETYGDDLVGYIIGEQSYSSRWIYLSNDQGPLNFRDRYSADYRFLVQDDGSIVAAHIKGIEYKTGVHSKMIGRCSGLEQKIRAYVACGTKLIIDEDEISTSHYGD